MPDNLPAGFVPDAGLPKGFVPDAPSPAAAQEKARMVTPLEGESFEQTMNRAIEMGKKVTPEEIQASVHSGIRKIPTVLGASLLAGPAVLGGGVIGPAAASSAVGGGVAGGAAGGAVGGASTTLMEKFLHAAAGENVATPQSALDIGTSALIGGGLGGALGLFEKVIGSLANSKLARGMINASVGATARDVTYGNPAAGILKAQVTSPFTGDLEAYKAALRTGAQPEQALVAAGGRVAQVAQKVNELAPQLEQLLAKSPAPIRVVDIIDKPLLNATNEIIGNKAMTTVEKDAAVTQLGALQHSLKEGLGETVTPLEANQIKQAIGNRINWAGNVAVTDEVKPAYRSVYGAIKNAVNKAVPGAAAINEDLTNLLAAQTDLEKLMKAEESGMGKGALGSAVTGIARRMEAVMGRVLPGAAAANQALQQATPLGSGPLGATIGEILKSKGINLPQAAPGQAGVPFHPGANQ